MSETINPSVDILSKSFEVYGGLLETVAVDHPQRQGFTDQAEFTTAVLDDQTRSTILSHDGLSLVIPQLVPVSCFEWLNDEYYAKKYSAETASGRIMHFANLPGVKPGEDVEAGLIDLADRGGVVAIDFPSTDPEYRGRLAETLQTMSIVVVEEELLGTQTYFAGQVKLRNGERADRKHVDLLSAFEEREKRGLVDAGEYSNGTTLVRSIDDPEIVDSLYEMYANAYVVLNDHPCKQGLSPKEFKDILLNDKESGKLVYSNNGDIETLCLVENNLTKLTWVNADFYRRKYPNKFKNGQIVWFPGIATDPDRQGADNSQNLINLMAALAEEGNNEFVGVFDFCDVNTGFLDRVFEDWINAAPQTSISLKPIADQRYYGLRLMRDQ